MLYKNNDTIESFLLFSLAATTMAKLPISLLLKLGTYVVILYKKYYYRNSPTLQCTALLPIYVCKGNTTKKCI